MLLLDLGAGAVVATESPEPESSLAPKEEPAADDKRLLPPFTAPAPSLTAAMRSPPTHAAHETMGQFANLVLFWCRVLFCIKMR